jgi:hypothetical protein
MAGFIIPAEARDGRGKSSCAAFWAEPAALSMIV